MTHVSDDFKHLAVDGHIKCWAYKIKNFKQELLARTFLSNYSSSEQKSYTELWVPFEITRKHNLRFFIFKAYYAIYNDLFQANFFQWWQIRHGWLLDRCFERLSDFIQSILGWCFSKFFFFLRYDMRFTDNFYSKKIQHCKIGGPPASIWVHILTF